MTQVPRKELLQALEQRHIQEARPLRTVAAEYGLKNKHAVQIATDFYNELAADNDWMAEGNKHVLARIQRDLRRIQRYQAIAASTQNSKICLEALKAAEETDRALTKLFMDIGVIKRAPIDVRTLSVSVDLSKEDIEKSLMDLR